MKKERIFCGIDIGSHQIKASVLRINRDCPIDILGVVQLKTQGVQENSVTDLRELSENIHRILSGLMRKTDIKLKNVVLGVGGHLVEKRRSTTLIPLLSKGSKAITQFDVRKADEQARLLGVNLDERLLHQIPTRYIIDGFNSATNPIGLIGRKLQTDIILVVIKNNLLNNLVNAVNQAGYEVSSVFFSSLCAAQTCLSSDEKKQGCLFLNIGSNSSDLIFFKDCLLKDILVIPYGGYLLTKKISEHLQLPFELTEEIKKSYAEVDSEPFKECRKQEILVKREKGYTPVDRSEICSAVMPFVREFINSIRDCIRQADMENYLNAGIIVSGGASLLTGLIEYIERETKLSVDIGKVLTEKKFLGHSAVYAGSIGLAQQQGQVYQANFSTSVKRYSPGISFLNRVKELYHEYF